MEYKADTYLARIIQKSHTQDGLSGLNVLLADAMFASIKSTMRCFFLALCLVGGITGCSTRQSINKPYPIWGKSIYLPSAHPEKSSHLQLLQTREDYSACILLVHGMNEHIGRYGHIAEFFSEKFKVIGMDLPAHGLSNPVLAKANQAIQEGNTPVEIEHAFQEQAEFSNLDIMRKDFVQALMFSIEQCDKDRNNTYLPVFILSHSLGSLVTASTLLTMEIPLLQQRIQGVIFTGPAFSVTEVPGWRGWLQNPLIKFTFHNHQHFLTPHDEAWPLLILNQISATVFVPLQKSLFELFSLPGLRTVFSPSTPDWVLEHLSDWEEERIRHENDYYVLRRSVLRYVLAIGQEIIQFRRNMAAFSLPYLLIYSEFDPITPAWGSWDFIQATQTNHHDNEAMLLTGQNHHEQLFSNPALRKQVLNKIYNWLCKRIKIKSPPVRHNLE